MRRTRHELLYQRQREEHRCGHAVRSMSNLGPYVRQGCFGMTGNVVWARTMWWSSATCQDEFKRQFADQAARMKLGYGLDESTDMGPYCTASGRDKVAASVRRPP